GRTGRLTTPEDQQISREEFQELVRDIEVEGEPSTPSASGRRATATQEPRSASQATASPPAAQRDPAADLSPEDLVLKHDKSKAKAKGPRNRRHGRSR